MGKCMVFDSWHYPGHRTTLYKNADFETNAIDSYKLYNRINRANLEYIYEPDMFYGFFNAANTRNNIKF